MGIRPKVMTVFGIDNFKGQKFDYDFDRCVLDDYVNVNAVIGGDDKFNLSFVKDFCYKQGGKLDIGRWLHYYDVLYCGNWEYGVDGILGLKTSRDFDSVTFRAMSLLNTRYTQSGYKIIPHNNLNYTYNDYYRIVGFKLRDSWKYGQGYHRDAVIWAYVFNNLCNWLGIETNVNAYKWMLVWEWS